MATTTKTRKAPAKKASPVPKAGDEISRPIMKWQYEQLIKELLLLQGHAADPTCPCKSEGEMCVRKHLLTVEALLSETAAMEKSETIIGTLNEHYEQARSLRLHEEKYLCGDEMTGEALKMHDSLAEWARMTRKVYEEYSLACSLKAHKAPAPSPIVEVIAPVPASEYEVTIAPPEPELGVQVEVVAPAPAPRWTAKDLLLAIYPKYSGEPDDGTFSHELNLAQRRFMQAFKEAKWDHARFVEVVKRLPYADDRIDYMEKVAEGKANRDRLTPDESVLVHRMAPRYTSAYSFASALYDLTLTDPEHWKAGDPDFPAPPPERPHRMDPHYYLHKYSEFEGVGERIGQYDSWHDLLFAAFKWYQTEPGSLWVYTPTGDGPLHRREVPLFDKYNSPELFPAPSPKDKAQTCADMREGELNHKHFLSVPEHPKTGNHDWHRRWIGIYQNAQRVIGCDCQRS